MGLAERFKEKLSSKNIFIENKIEETLEKQDIMFISKPPVEEQKDEVSQEKEVLQEENISQQEVIPQDEIVLETEIKTIQKEEILKPVKNVLIEEIKPSINITKFEDLESELISKIRKTPYWEEYSIQRQEKMINSYFIKKIQNYTLEEKNEFVKNILTLANNR